jgi:hypothetical protein
MIPLSALFAFLGLLLSVISAGLFAYPIMFQTNAEIGSISSTCVEENPDLIKSMKKARDFARYGIFFLVLGTIFQFISIWLQGMC